MPEDQLAELLALHHDGLLDEAGRQRLVALLESDPAARAAFRRELQLSAALRQEAALDVLVRTGVRRKRWRWGIAAGLTAAALAATLAVVLLRPAPTSEHVRFAGADVANGETVRGQGELHWPDGSVATLSADAVVRLEAGERRALLQFGAMSVQVAHQQPGRSFLIAVGGVDVRALGTRFTARADAASLRVTVAAGVVAVGNDREVQMLFAGDSWSRGVRNADAAKLEVDQAVRDAARAAGRVDAAVIADYGFDDAAGATVRDRSGHGMDLAIAPGKARWTPGGLSITGRDALRWEGDARPFRTALESEGLSIEIAWDGEPAAQSDGLLLELGRSRTDQDSFVIAASPTDSIHHLVLCLGREDTRIYTDGQRTTLFPAASEAALLPRRLLSGPHLVMSLHGIAHRVVKPGVAQGERPWTATFRRITIHGRALSAEEIRRNALADESERARRR